MASSTPDRSSQGSASAGTPARVLLVENGIGYGGAIICLRHLVRHLDRDRFEPLVITGRTGPNYREIADEARWLHLRDRYINVVGMRDWIARQGWSQRVPGLPFLLGQIVSRLDDIGNFLPFFLKLLWVAARFQPAIIHANNEPLSNRATLFVGKLLRTPVVSHIRADVRDVRFGRRLYRLPDYFICVSQWVSDGLGRLGVPADRKSVVYDGIPLETLDTSADGSVFRARFGIPTDAFAVGLVGLLIPWKGQEIFIEAARQLAARIPNLRMLIVGGTPDDCRLFERSLRESVARQGLADVVVFTGHVNEMPVIYQGLDVVVSASVTPEPLGTMVIEAMTMARPLVVPNHGGGAEMVEDGCTGLQFQAGSADSLADAIWSLYQDRALGERLGTAARAKALATFAVDTHVQRVQEIYAQLLSKR